MEKPTLKTRRNIPRIAYLFVLILILVAIPLVSAFDFDNIKGDLIKNKDTSEYGKIEIRNSMFGWGWFQLDKIMSLELLENTEQCLAEGCSATTEIIMYEDGKLIDDVKFIDLETGMRTTIKNYDIYVDGDLYNGKEVLGNSNGIKYDVELRGQVHPFQKVDWQIKSANTNWIDEWASWTSALSVDLLAYWNCDDSSGDLIDSLGSANATYKTNTPLDVGGIVNNATYSTGDDYWTIANQSVGTGFNSTESDFTFSFWFNQTVVTGYMINSISGDFYYYTGEGLFRTDTFAVNYIWDFNITANRSYFVTLVRNESTSTMDLYVDGVYNGTLASPKGIDFEDEFNNVTGISFLGNNGYKGWLDEIAMWNRSLSFSEIDDLYNGGSGITYELPATTVVLNSPIDNYDTANKTVTFNCTATADPSAGNISNISLYHNETGTWTLNQTNSTPRIHNSTAIFDVTFPDFESIEWNCYACDNSSACAYGTNRSLNIERLAINSETYNNHTIEGSLETFIINITTAELYINTATLTYNNTEYAGTLTQDGFDYIISVTLNVDSISTAVNLTFNWTFLMEDLSTFYSDNHNQSILALSLGTCGVTNNITILNYTLYDEDNLTKLDGATFSTIIELDVSIYAKGTTNEILSFSNTFNNTNPAEVCMDINLGNTKYRMDTSTTYTAKERELEHHYLQNFSLTNTTTYQNISLYNLNSSKSTIFLITYKDTNFLPVENALINIQREYLGDGLFRSVEIGKTDADGQTIGHFIQNDVVYTLIVSKEGVVLSTFDNIVAWCDDVIAENCQINLNQFDTGIPVEAWDTYQNLDYTLSFDKDTRTVSLIFVTLDGSSVTVTLNTTKSDRWMNDTVCSDIVISSSGTLTCVIGAGYGNVSVISKVYMNEELITQANFGIFPDRDDYFGGTGIIFLLILVIILPLMFVTSTVGVVLGSIFGIIIAGALMIYTDFSWLGVRSSIIWLIIAGIILIWKIHERSKT